jgi:hypothetical protein
MVHFLIWGEIISPQFFCFWGLELEVQLILVHHRKKLIEKTIVTVHEAIRKI